MPREDPTPLVTTRADKMNPEEIRAEIERRKKVARDLKLSQKVWSLYNSNFQYIDERLKKDTELIFPEYVNRWFVLVAPMNSSSRNRLKYPSSLAVRQLGRVVLHAAYIGSVLEGIHLVGWGRDAEGRSEGGMVRVAIERAVEVSGMQ